MIRTSGARAFARCRVTTPVPAAISSKHDGRSIATRQARSIAYGSKIKGTMDSSYSCGIEPAKSVSTSDAAIGDSEGTCALERGCPKTSICEPQQCGLFKRWIEVLHDHDFLVSTTQPPHLRLGSSMHRFAVLNGAIRCWQVSRCYQCVKLLTKQVGAHVARVTNGAVHHRQSRHCWPERSRSIVPLHLVPDTPSKSRQ